MVIKIATIFFIVVRVNKQTITYNYYLYFDNSLTHMFRTLHFNDQTFVPL